ncbi:hypothetical protein ONZ45_g17368 [Pleurotus djamor]|nr:hypothetical protein ONZ45_g17368 [Pleurotus djamor]
MPSLSIPAEVLYHTFRLIDDADSRYTLLFVSRLFHLLAEPLVYSKAALGSPASVRGKHLDSSLDLFSKRLEANDGRLALCVRQLVLALPQDTQFAYEKTLYHLTRLQRLWLFCEAYQVFPPDPSRCRFLLTHLTWHTPIGSAIESFTSFLENQPLLEHLDILSSGAAVSALELPITTLTRLLVLKAPLPTVLSLLPGRSILHVETKLHCVAPRTYEEPVSNAIAKLRSLAWSAMDFEAFSSFAVHLHDITDIQLRIQRFWMLKDVPGVITVLDSTQVNLLRLTIGTYLQYKLKGSTYREMADQAFRSLTSLAAVEVENELERSRVCYDRDGKSTCVEYKPVAYPWDSWWSY